MSPYLTDSTDPLCNCISHVISTRTAYRPALHIDPHIYHEPLVQAIRHGARAAGAIWICSIVSDRSAPISSTWWER